MGAGGEDTSVSDVSDAGILLDSAFYFLKDWSRKQQLVFASDDVQKAELTLKFANEDALAVKELCDAVKVEVALEKLRKRQKRVY